VKTLTDRIRGSSEGELERLRDIVSVHVMHRRHSIVRQHQRLTTSNSPEHLWIEMSGGIDRLPSRSNEVAGMQNYRAGISTPSGVEQELFDRTFLDPIVAERMSRRVLSYSAAWFAHSTAFAVHPHRPAMKEHRLPGT